MSTEIRSRIIVNSMVSLISAPRCSSSLQFKSVSRSETLDVLRNLL